MDLEMVLPRAESCQPAVELVMPSAVLEVSDSVTVTAKTAMDRGQGSKITMLDKEHGKINREMLAFVQNHRKQNHLDFFYQNVPSLGDAQDRVVAVTRT